MVVFFIYSWEVLVFFVFLFFFWLEFIAINSLHVYCVVSWGKCRIFIESKGFAKASNTSLETRKPLIEDFQQEVDLHFSAVAQ